MATEAFIMASVVMEDFLWLLFDHYLDFRYLCTVGYAENPNWYEEHLHLAFGGVYDLIFREDQYGIAVGTCW